MKLTCIVVFAFVLLSAGALAAIPSEPDYTLLWNDFTAVTVVDSFAVATGSNGLVILARDAVSGAYEERDHVFLLAEPTWHKRRGDVLAVASDVGVIYFFDLTALPALPTLGIADLGYPYGDFTWDGDDLYVARGFDGLWRYELTAYSNPAFVDSSMLGIHYVQTEIDGDDLYALDDYNGILKCDRSSGGFGTFEDYLYIPFRAQSFVVADTLLGIAGVEPELLLGTFAGGPRVIDSIALIFAPDRIFAADTMIAAFTREAPTVDLVSLNSGAVYTASLAVAPDTLFGGSVFPTTDGSSLMLPSLDGGLQVYALNLMAINPQPVRALARPGPVTALALRNGELYTGGGGNPVDRYLLAGDGRPDLDTTYFPGITGVQSLEQNGDTLLVVYGSLNRIFLIDTKSDSIPFLGSVRPSGRRVTDINYIPHAFDTLHAFYTSGLDIVELFSVDDSSGIEPQSQIGLVEPIVDAVVVDSLLVMVSDKSGLVVFRIYDDLDLEFRQTRGLAFEPTHMAVHDGRVYVFAGNNVDVYSARAAGGLVFDTSVAIYRNVWDSDVVGDVMYAIGPDGIAVFDLADGVPELVTEGGRPGFRIVAENDLVVISDSVSMHVFRVPVVPTDIDDPPLTLPTRAALLPNFPNPFNPETTIRFVLPAHTDVRLTVHNLLGQEVAELTNREYPAGEYELVWRGENSSGQPVASGVYFYRLITDAHTFTRKMVLLK